MNPHRIMINQRSKPQSAWDAGESMSISGWTHTMEFWAFRKAKPGTIRIAVGEAMNPHRIMINQSSRPQSAWDAGESMSIAEWTHYKEFWAFREAQPGTIRIAVGEAKNPHRIMINNRSKPQSAWDAGESMSISEWTHKMEFWAFREAKPGTIRIAVGEAMNPHRIMINQRSKPQSAWDAGKSMSIAGWTHTMEFWAFREAQPGTIRIAVGEAMNPHRIMINQSSKPQSA